MKSGAILLAAVAILWTALVTTADGRRQPPAPQAAPSTPALSAPVAPPPASTTSADYLGSAACRRCHEVEQEQWERSLHVRMTKPVAEALVVGDFSEGTRFEDHGRSYTFGRKDGKPYIAVASGGRPAETFTVDYTLGRQALSGLPVDDGGWAHLRAAGVLAHRQPAVGGLEGDHAHPRRRARSAVRSGTPTASTATARTSSRATTSRRSATTRPGPRWASAARPVMVRAGRTWR